MTTTPLDVLIAGAGPTGLALACHCRRLGLRVRVVEKKPERSTTSKAIGLQYRVSELLAIMGVADRFVARGHSATLVNIHAGGRQLLQLKFRDFGHLAGRDAFAPRAIMLPQSATEEMLGDLLREHGGAIEWGTEFVRFEQDDAKVVSLVRHADGREEEVTSSWLVSCEGAHSGIRRQAGIDFVGKTYPLAFVMADVELDWRRGHDENHVWIHQDGNFAALPLPGSNTWRLMVELTKDRELSPDAVTLDAIRAMMAKRTGDTTTKATNPTWISEFRIHARMVDRYRAGRVFLAGDAAHIHSPTGGQGITTGMQDAANLAWKLARVARGAPDALLDTYQEERLPQAREVLKETDRTTSLLYPTSTAMRLLRDYVVLPVLRLDRVQKAMFAKLAQLHVHYRKCRLSRQQGWSWTGLRAGDRAPDVAFDLEGKRTTLFELLRPLKPVVLIGADSPPGEARGAMELLGRAGLDAYLVGAPGLLDRHGDLRRMYGLTGSFLCLVRPDGHLGLVQRPPDVRGLREYLELLCPAEAIFHPARLPVGPRGG